MAIMPSDLPPGWELSEMAERVRGLDPLAADDLLSRLPEMNASADVQALTRALAAVLPATVAGWSASESLAAMRDLGLLAGSLQRHGISPVTAVPGLEPILLALGERTRMAPRDTIVHYTHLAPHGGRQRTYTGHPQERTLITTVATTVTHLATAIDLCHDLKNTDPASPAFPQFMHHLTEQIDAFDHAMDTVSTHVTPDFFTHRLRPYFGPIRIGGALTPGPAAAHIPLFIIDLALWASGHPVEQTIFKETTATYTYPQWRETAERWQRETSLKSRISTAIASARSDNSRTASVRDSAHSTALALRALIRFRAKHLHYVRRTYNTRNDTESDSEGHASVDRLRTILAQITAELGHRCDP
jgi:monodechloroaminopyrrolnitrin synthase